MVDVDPLPYYVNDVSDLRKEVVDAYMRNNQDHLNKILSKVEHAFNVFICVNRQYSRCCILCVPVRDGPAGPLEHDFIPDQDSKPFEIPNLSICWCYTIEEGQSNMYKIRKEFSAFRDFKDRIIKSFYIGKYTNTNPNALDLATLRAAPRRYGTLLDDCVEFSKDFCIQLLAYCENWRELEEVVHDRIQKASATGLSIETLSRRVESSALFGNTFLGGLDVSSFLSGTHSTATVVAVVALVLIYPILVAVLITIFFP